MNYYSVTAKCGHVGGRSKYILNTFFLEAESGKAAAKIARRMGRVKHDQKDAIQAVEKIPLDEYQRGCAEFMANPFNWCKNVQEQRIYWEEIAPMVREEQTVTYKFKSPRHNDKRARSFGYARCGKPNRGWEYEEDCA